MTTTTATKSDKYQEWIEELRDKLIAGIDSTDGKFTLPWQNLGNVDLLNPTNAVTGKSYQGGNVFALFYAATESGYSTGTWATFKQWQSIGAQVRKGEHGTGCVFWKVMSKRTKDGDQTDETFMLPRFFVVFNADQVDGYAAPVIENPLSDDARMAQVEAFMAATGADIRHGGDRAYYSPSTDHVQLPEFAQFVDGISYYSTAAHELTHWTGHGSRLARTTGKRFGDEAYAFEELVAEMGAAFTLAHFGLSAEPREDHAQYLKGWLRVLVDQPKALWTAASMASKALAHLLEITGSAVVADETEEVAA